MKILFVCRENMFRSHVVETFFKNMGNKDVEIQSCGTQVEKEGLTGKKLKEFPELENFLEVMKEKSFDISENVCKQITSELAYWANKIISMAKKDESPDYLINIPRVTFWKDKNPDNITKDFANETVHQTIKLSLFEFMFRKMCILYQELTWL